jgi:hypothetical protein
MSPCSDCANTQVSGHERAGRLVWSWIEMIEEGKSRIRWLGYPTRHLCRQTWQQTRHELRICKVVKIKSAIEREGFTARIQAAFGSCTKDKTDKNRALQ